MMKVHKMFIGSVLKNLGQPAVPEDVLEEALQKAFYELKVERGMEPDETKLLFNLVAVERDWAEETFEMKAQS